MGVPISGLPAAAPLTGVELVPLAQASITVKATAAAVAALGGGPTGLTINSADDTVTVRNLTYLEVDGTNGLTLSTPGGTTATLGLQAADGSTVGKPGAVIDGTQWFGGDKNFTLNQNTNQYLFLVPDPSNPRFGWSNSSVGYQGQLQFDPLAVTLKLVLPGYVYQAQLLGTPFITIFNLISPSGGISRFAVDGVSGQYGVGAGGDTFTGGICSQLGTSDSIPYTPATLGNWAGTPPATIFQALDRCAAALVAGGHTP